MAITYDKGVKCLIHIIGRLIWIYILHIIISRKYKGKYPLSILILYYTDSIIIKNNDTYNITHTEDLRLEAGILYYYAFTEMKLNLIVQTPL